MLLTIFALLALAFAEPKYFLQFTDLHIEKNYKPGSDTGKRCVAGEGDTPQIAFIGCDLWDKTIKMYLEAVKEKYPNPEFIMYNGDSNPHFIDVGYASKYTREDVLEYAEYGVKLIHEVFPDVQLIPIIGNHDNYPSDQLAINEEGMQHLQTLGSYFAEYIPQSEVDTLVTKGYYVHDIGDDMRIVVMTTVLCDLVNFYATLTGGENDMGMFDAVAKELEKARAEGKHVLMALHRPAGKTETSTVFADFLPLCRNKLGEIYENYQDILTYGSFTGHTHKNSFRLFTDSTGKPTHVQFVSIPLTTYSSQQAGSSLFYYDDTKHIITDVIEIYMDTDESNSAGKVVLKEFNSFIEDFGIPDLTAKSMYEVYKKNVSDKNSGQLKNYYARMSANYSGAPRMSNKVWAEVACGSGPVDPELYSACIEKLKKGEPYVVE